MDIRRRRQRQLTGTARCKAIALLGPARDRT